MMIMIKKNKIKSTSKLKALPESDKNFFISLIINKEYTSLKVKYASALNIELKDVQNELTNLL
ncbi:MAG: hypothetical protein LUH15_15120 [Tannerellaceae bacterium]|nr:hypothetical protein [Tannerellaceae bacterium]